MELKERSNNIDNRLKDFITDDNELMAARTELIGDILGCSIPLTSLMFNEYSFITEEDRLKDKILDVDNNTTNEEMAQQLISYKIRLLIENSFNLDFDIFYKKIGRVLAYRRYIYLFARDGVIPKKEFFNYILSKNYYPSIDSEGVIFSDKHNSKTAKFKNIIYMLNMIFGNTNNIDSRFSIFKSNEILYNGFNKILAGENGRVAVVSFANTLNAFYKMILPISNANNEELDNNALIVSIKTPEGINCRYNKYKDIISKIMFVNNEPESNISFNNKEYYLHLLLGVAAVIKGIPINKDSVPSEYLNVLNKFSKVFSLIVSRNYCSTYTNRKTLQTPFSGLLTPITYFLTDIEIDVINYYLIDILNIPKEEFKC